jgi:hypothetical protein
MLGPDPWKRETFTNAPLSGGIAFCDGLCGRLRNIEITETVTQPATYPGHGRLSKAGWWGRLLVAAAVAFYLVYTPIHLATEQHCGPGLAALVHEVLHHHWHGDARHEGSAERDAHRPHPALEHDVSLATRTQLLTVVAPVFLLGVETTLVVRPAEPDLSSPWRDYARPPAQAPPGPRRPRAPPLV